VVNEDFKLFQQLIEENRYNFVKLAYIIFPFGQKGHALEHMAPYEWQVEEWHKLSRHLSNPKTRYETYRLIVSSGNGAAKTAFGAMTFLMLMYTQRLRARITANTDPQMKSIVWPEYDLWLRHARYNEHFFEKFGTSIKAKDEKLAETWRLDTVTWDEQRPSSISGLHNKGGAILYIFEEAAGIPAIIWQYASGAFTETETIKLFFAFANSDDPESKFEQNMTSPLWNARRIDTRTLSHIDPKQIQDWLMEAGGNEDADEFRVRVRGLPRKTSKDSILSQENVTAALDRAKGFDKSQLAMLPVILTCDPAWTGGDETTIWYRQGNYACLLEKYKLDKAAGQDHMFTFLRLCYWERELGADAVFIDQGEGTAIYTLANNAQKTSWELVSFAGSPNDTPEFRDSEYANIRAQMYYETNKFLQKGGILDAKDPEWIPIILKQLCWTKGGRHKVHNKKIAEPKLEIKNRVGQSPDVADGLVLTFARPVIERLPENDVSSTAGERFLIGGTPYKMPDHGSPYDDIEANYVDLYDR
jgi:hypothetical protein